MKRFFLINLCVLFSVVAFNARAMDMRNFTAYPVPFNPKKVVALTIGNRVSAGALDAETLSVEIYDINGDLVYRRKVNASSMKWNGRNERGLRVKPGLYIIRVKAEKQSTGDFGEKNLRVLVSY